MDKSLIIILIASFVSVVIILAAIAIRNSSTGSEIGTKAHGPGFSFKRIDAKWLKRALGIVIVVVLLIWLGPAIYRWVTTLDLSQENAGQPVSEETMDHVMAPRHDTGWSRAITDPSGDITAFFLCPAAGPEKACSDYNTDMAKAPFEIQCQKTSGDVFLDWTMDGCRNIYAFRVRSKTDQPVRIGYWFERITK